jgi:hypothetical protein
VASVEIAPIARVDLDELIATRGLPVDTDEHVWHSLRVLETFPLGGRALGGAWEGHRLLVGPWRWLLIVYRYVEESDLVAVVAFRDGRSGSSVMTSGK